MSALIKTVFTILILIFLAASVWDIILTLISYFEYDTDVITTYATPIGTILPMVTFCGQKSQFVTNKFYEETFGHPVSRPISPEDSTTITELFHNMTFKEQFDVLFSKEDLKELIKWHVIHDERGPFHWPDEINLSMNNELFCFTMEHEYEHKYFSRGDEFDPAMTFKLSFKVPEIMAFVHMTGEPLFDLKEHKPQVINLEPNKVTILNYELTMINLLPAPYDTNCHNYSRAGPESYYHLYNSYVKNGFINHYQCLPDNYLIQTGEDIMPCPRHTVESSFLDRLFWKVDQTLQEECEQEYYSLTTDKGFTMLNINMNATDSHTIHVYPVELSKRMVCVPMMRFMELVRNVGDEVCEWLALLCIYLLIKIVVDNQSSKQMSI